MLLQRASAGSGKTYRLAKTYIRLFISRLDQDSGRYILLPPAALRENHAHILGVTFTNKATNEMKERIVARLADLAQTHPAPGFEPDGWEAPSFLKDFTGETAGATDLDDIIYNTDGTRVTRADITRTARAALKALLNDYGDFNISTIDSFFQTVLRSFAYELGLNDNFRIEIDDTMMARIGVDETLSQVNDPASKRHDIVTAWVQDTAMEQIASGSKWNVFEKRSSAGLYAQLVNFSQKLFAENYRLISESLISYFQDPDRFPRFYKACLDAQRAQLQELHTLLLESLENVCSLIDELARNAGKKAKTNKAGNYLGKDIGNFFARLRATKPATNYKDTIPINVLPHVSAAPEPFPADSNPFVTNIKSNRWGLDSGLMAECLNFCQALFRWQNAVNFWLVVLSRLRYMGLLASMHLSTRQFREDNNLIPLSDTTTILRRLIGKTDTPFIYERLGANLRHFLLDEFQDTSVMQWANLKPLLLQGSANGDESLIIGDAKQSIYRFRNAEPDIINRLVKEEIPDTRENPAPGDSAEKRAEVNSNWRSATEMVRANNTLFSLLPAMLDEKTGGSELGTLYSTAIQKVRNTNMHGYVNICFDEPLGSEFAPEPEPEAEPAPEPIAEIEPEPKQPKGRQPAKAPYDNLGYLIDHLRERGYRLEDIAILVNKNTEGEKVIAALLAHNARMKAINPAYRPIELLSEESLKITESPAVQVILAVLRTIGRGFLAPESAVKTPVSKVRKYELTQFVANFHCLRAAKPDMPLEELLKSDLEQALPPEVITSMLASLPATTLPALVEGIAARFTADLGDNQTPYIAAFQDTVIDYCENYTPDVASFLSWWDKNGDLISIGAPSDAKAVRVMTIHKSKGLEFPVVIMPLANWSIEPDSHSLGKTMLWIPTPGSLADALKALPNPPACRDIPGNIPITPAFSMADSLDPTMRASYADFAAKHIVDQLNKLYVAFTRAICELHVYAPFGKDSAKAKTHPLGELLNLAGSQIMAGNPAGIGAKLKLTPEDTDFQQNRYLRCGEPQYPKENPEKTKPSDTIIINQYVNSGPAARLVTQTS